MIQCLYDWFGDSEVHSMLATCHGNVEMSIVGSENDNWHFLVKTTVMRRRWPRRQHERIAREIHTRIYVSKVLIVHLFVNTRKLVSLMNNVVRGYPRWCQCVSFSLEFPTFIDSTHASTVHPYVSFPQVKHKHGEGQHSCSFITICAAAPPTWSVLCVVFPPIWPGCRSFW
jgi:hypothetical protein